MPDSLKNIPLDYYHCTFFLPLSGLNDNEFSPQTDFAYHYCPDNDLLSAAEKQAYHYFTPALRNILFDCPKHSSNSLKPVKEWRLPKEVIAQWSLHLGLEKDKKEPFKYQQVSFEEVRLFRYFNGIYLLSFRVMPEDISQNPALENWLHFSRLARLVYPSFNEQVDEDKIAPLRLLSKLDHSLLANAFTEHEIKIPQKTGEYISPVLRYLLKQFAVAPKRVDALMDNYHYLYDDRMFVSVAYSIAGEQRPAEQLQRIFNLMATVDRVADAWVVDGEYAYTPHSIKQWMQGKHLDFWNEVGGYFAFTEFSNTYLSRGDFFTGIIAPDHIPYEYDRMLVQALFYQASLRLYDDGISRETSDILDLHQYTDIRKKRADFIRFTNQYWFHTVTEQMQGKLIFDLQKKNLGLQDHYDVIKDELERTDEYLQTGREVRLKNLSDTLTKGGLVAAFLALYYAALPLWKDYFKDQQTASDQVVNLSLWERAGTFFGVGSSLSEPIGFGILLVVVPVLITVITLVGIKVFGAFKKTKN